MISKPLGTTIFCDDIRKEVGGGLTIIGANVKDEILFPKRTNSNPDEGSICMIPILGFFVKIIVPISYEFETAVMQLIQIENTKENILFNMTIKKSDFPNVPLESESDEPTFFKLNIAERIPGVMCRPKGKIQSRITFDRHDLIALGALVYNYKEI